MQDLVQASGETVTKVWANAAKMWDRSVENHYYEKLRGSTPAMVKIDSKTEAVITKVWKETK